MPFIDRRGIEPSQLVGKVLSRARRSPEHPALTLDFADNTSYQILVDGYNPRYKGIPKELEMNESFDNILLSNDGFIGLQIVDCAIITLSDIAFERKQSHSQETNLQWDKRHLGVAFKFAEDTPRWHCVWATLTEYDKDMGSCIFRSYDDVYLERLDRSPRKPRSPKKKRRDSFQPEYVFLFLNASVTGTDVVASI
ncbi:hypothetical protein VNI00_004111 [Paramarasmius palmivorus]|uniref:Uncharacterized protein n=1 Tax=Paramarasmius palmivorus TaxID=297713 RepID=A0AAW0DQN8_9AGAR